MKSLFITVRYDRMKNKNLNSLYYRLLSNIKLFPTNIPELENALNRLRNFDLEAETLLPKRREKLHTKEITELRAKKDKIVVAMQYQLKALIYAQFDEEKEYLREVVYPLEVIFKDYKKKLIFEKEMTHLSLTDRLKVNKQFENAMAQLGLMRYVNKLDKCQEEIKELLQKQKKDQDKRPAPNSSIPCKEKLIEAIRVYLRTIDMYQLYNPDAIDKSLFIAINMALKEARSNLRNITTRRIRKNEKLTKIEEKIKETD